EQVDATMDPNKFFAEQRFTRSCMKHWEIIADNLSKAGWHCGCISSTDHEGRQFWVVAAEREDAGRFIVRADEKLSAFVELPSAIRSEIRARGERRLKLQTCNAKTLQSITGSLLKILGAVC